MDFKNLKKKIHDFLLNVCDFRNEIPTLGYGFKNL